MYCRLLANKATFSFMTHEKGNPTHQKVQTICMQMNPLLQRSLFYPLIYLGKIVAPGLKSLLNCGEKKSLNQLPGKLKRNGTKMDPNLSVLVHFQSVFWPSSFQSTLIKVNSIIQFRVTYSLHFTLFLHLTAPNYSKKTSYACQSSIF